MNYGKKSSFDCWKKIEADIEHRNLMRLWYYIQIFIFFNFHAHIFPGTNITCKSFRAI